MRKKVVIMNYINLDFCIIENPLDKNKKPIIFVTRKGVQRLDETVVKESDYERAIYAIQNIGYVESDTLTFESSQESGHPNIAVDEIKKILEGKGMEYSQQLEKSIKNELDMFNLMGAKQLIKDLGEESGHRKNKKSLNSKAIISLQKNSVYKIPEVGEKITLFFYLFIECKFIGEKCYLNLNGDFTSKENNDLRNYLLPFKCDFIRINNVYNPNRIILKSCLINSDILKNLPIDYSGSFNLKTKVKDLVIDKLFVYYLMEVKNNFPLENRITIEIDNSINYDQMISMSKGIKKYYEKLFNGTKYVISHLPDSLEKMREILTQKMLTFADEDEFEKASKVKEDINYINKMSDKTDKKTKEGGVTTYYQFIKNFHIN